MLDDLDRRIIRRVCGDIGESLHPFRQMAQELGIEEAQLLARLQRYAETGTLRRFGAILRHQKAGFVANGMSVWNVPDADVDRVGRQMAQHREVSHCYERPRPPGWPYNLYGMIHGRTREECRAVADRISREVAIDDYQVLFTVREFKKTSMVYLEDPS